MTHRLILWALVSLSAARAAGAPLWQVTEKNETGFTVDWTAPDLTLQNVKRAGHWYTRVGLPGFENSGLLGGPSLPTQSRFLAVPAGFSVGLDAVEIDSEIKECDHPVDFEARKRTHCLPHLREVTADDLIYEDPDPEMVEISAPSQAGALSLVKLTINPVRRESGQGLTVMKRVKFRVTYRPLGRLEEGFRGAWISEAEQSFFKGLVLNPEVVPDPVRGDRRVDLLLTTAKFATALEPLIRFKQSQGREVRLRILKERASTSVIKNLIATEYGAGVTPSHTILVGSIDDVASYKKPDDYWSDYPYTLLDAGNLPDLSLGRLPARTPEELTALVEKIVQRETAPRDDAAVLMTSGEETNWCQVNLNYIRDHILLKGQIPLQITKLYSNEGATTAKVLAAYNANPNLVIYDGHGNSSGMIEIPLVTKNLPDLKNTAYPLIFDIACLNAYWPASGAKTRNFADSIALLRQSGAAGILASSNFSGGHDLFRAIFRASVFDELDTAAPYHNLHEVGDAIRFGKIKYLEANAENAQALADNEMFFYLGDPASTIFHTPVIPLDDEVTELPLELDHHPDAGE